MVSNSANSLLGIINDILDFSKIEAGKLEISEDDVEFINMVESCLELVSDNVYKKQVKLVYFVEPSIPKYIWADETRIRQVLLNLLSNAIKFTSEGKIELIINYDTAKQRLKFEIKDTGIGIAPEAQTKLFHSFSQADGSTTRKYGGTGLGLSISKQLVELMGGEIGFQSELGKGSCFWFSLPIIPTSETQNQPCLKIFQYTQQLNVFNRNSSVMPLITEQYRLLNIELIMNESLENWIKTQQQHPKALMVLDLNSLLHFDLTLDAVKQQFSEVFAEHYPNIIVLLTPPQQHDAELIKQAKAMQMLTVTKPMAHSKLYEYVDAFQGQLKQQASHKDSIKPVETLPFNVKTQIDPPSANRAELTPATQSDQAATCECQRVLLVEDNFVNQKLAIALLEKIGLKVDLAENGQQAIEALQAQAYPLVLMDCQMPVMDGYAATEQIRQLDTAMAKVPVIAMTANAMTGDKDRCLASGMNDYISKPINPKILQERVQYWLDHSASTLR